MQHVRPFGLWDSPLGLEQAALLKLSASTLRTHGQDRYWIEGRPELGGRRVVLRAGGDGLSEVVSPEELSLASRVHEYGGGELVVLEDGGARIFGVRADDQAIVSFRPGDDKVEVVVEGVSSQAVGGLASAAGWLVFVVEERATTPVRRSVWGLELDGGAPIELLAGRGFYHHVGLDPAGEMLVWGCWDHPSMSWDAGELWRARFDGGTLGTPERLAGGLGRPAGSPTFVSDGALAWLEEIDGFSRPVVLAPDGVRAQLGRPSTDYGGPAWVLGEHALIEVAGSLVGIEQRAGLSHLVVVHEGGSMDLGVAATSLSTLAPAGGRVAWLGSTPAALGAVGLAPLDGQGGTLIPLGPPSPFDEGQVAVAVPVAATANDGRELFGLLWRPTSTSAQGPRGEAPPAIVVCHGGPTSMARAGFDPMVQLFCSRGFAVVAPNYGGSSGFGAAYRHRLDGSWGVVDVADCTELVELLGAAGELDAKRVAIRGSSAGGLTALLAATTGAFAAVVSWYGVADLLTLAESTHDFEAHYLDTLVGPLPEARARYVERSPVTRASEMRAAVLLLQGEDDLVVPPSQAEAMAKALRAADEQVELHRFDGEGHGFRRFETLRDAYAAELAFYQRHLCGRPG